MHTYTDPNTLTSAARMTGVVRRLRALAWMGHDPSVVAVKYHAPVLLLRELCNARAHTPLKRGFERSGFPVDVWYAVATAYDDLGMTFGDSEHYRAKALDERWMPPLAWDDDALDDTSRYSNKNGRPAAGVPPVKTPEHDHAVVIRRINGDHTVHMSPADRRECVRVLHGRGMTDWAIADALGMWIKQVGRTRNELGLESNYDGSRSVMTRNYTPGMFSRAKISGTALTRTQRRHAARRRDLDPAA